MKSKIFLLLLCAAMTGNLLAVPGALKGKFSTNKNGTKAIQFSQGNLQYQASTNTWQFAEHQYDIIGEGNENISSTYDGWIDLFGFGSSGYYDKVPYMTSEDPDDYALGSKKSITGTVYDWGIHNAISNGGNATKMWRTLDHELYDILHNRPNAAKLFGFGTIDGVKGMILLPDDWPTPAPLTFNPALENGMVWVDYNFYYDNPNKNNFSHNTYTKEQWNDIMQPNGAVFLPVTGYRVGTTYHIGVDEEGDGEGCYWMTTFPAWGEIERQTQYNQFTNNLIITGQIYSDGSNIDNYHFGYAVRLIKEYEAPSVSYAVTISQPEHGTVSLKETGIDLSAVLEGTLLHFVATPEEGYELDAWSGCDADGSLTVNGAATVTCTFKKQTFQVTFVDWDDAVLKPAQTVNWGEAALPPSDPVRVDYDFTGWDTDFSSVKSDLTVKAQYKEVDKTVYYTVTYYDWDMTVLGTEKVEEGHDAEGWKPEPTRENYDFTGWSKPLTNITSDLSVQAQYEEKKVYFTVTYYDWDLTVLGTEKVEEGHDAEGWKPEPTREGYDFTGWSKSLTNITSDLSVQAQYEVAKVWYTVTYYDWDLTILGTEKVAEGETAEGWKPEPEREGYDFTGWSKPLTNITSDLSVQAQYEVAKVWYTVTYYDWDLTVLGTEKVAEGETAEGWKPEPEREGYDFTGWSKPLTNITSDLSVQAQYEKKEPTSIGETPTGTPSARKYLRNGVLYIRTNGTTYNAQGHRID